SRLASGVSLGAAGEVGGAAWRRYARRAPADATDGAFLADPLSQILSRFSELSIKIPHDRAWAAVTKEQPSGPLRFPSMTRKPFLAASCALMLASAAHAQAPAAPATPPAQTATPAASQPTNCAPMSPEKGTGATAKDGTT